MFARERSHLVIGPQLSTSKPQVPGFHAVWIRFGIGCSKVIFRTACQASVAWQQMLLSSPSCKNVLKIGHRQNCIISSRCFSRVIRLVGQRTWTQHKCDWTFVNGTSWHVLEPAAFQSVIQMKCLIADMLVEDKLSDCTHKVKPIINANLVLLMRHNNNQELTAAWTKRWRKLRKNVVPESRISATLKMSFSILKKEERFTALFGFVSKF